ncbi:MAG: PASTA domain-containing protein [Clostridia bacterium]|nr:PASTA domain-containing protein [Clostridia bacterium]
MKDPITPSAKRGLRTAKRASILLLIFSLILTYLGGRLFLLQIPGYRAAQEKVMDEITVSSALAAKRGDILDSSGRILATDKTVYRIYISPKNIARREKEDGIAYGERIARGLSSLLGLSYETVLAKTKKIRYLDETVSKNVEEDTVQSILSFIEEERLDGLILTEATESRYYPYGTLAAHVLGFTGSDRQGLYGLEYSYNEDLSGKDGQYLFAVDAHGNDKSYQYTTFEPATDGLSLVTTLDTFIQRELESVLAEIIEEFDVRDRATGIVMDVNTGAILAMATAPTFDLNSPYTPDALSLSRLSSLGYSPGSEEYTAKKKEYLQEMWKNKAVSELYEPGSTFKIVTSAIALDLGVTTPDDASFFCGGSYSPVNGVRISCWRRIGHGHGFTYGYGLQQSCNCAMMQVIARIGSEKFYQYVSEFGILEPTGIDLAGEARSIFHSLSGLGTVELATSSFGQRFKVSPLTELTAIAAVANGGYLVTPHLIDRLVDQDGKTVYQYAAKAKRQVVSESAARQVSSILEEGVSGTGASRNAYAAGYRIAAKTGTSEKLDKQDENGGYSLRIGSCVGYAPYDDPQIAMIIVVDEPTTAHYGATVAAPYISRMMSRVLPYLGYDPVYKSEEEAIREVTVGNYVGMTVKDAEKALAALGIHAVFEGSDTNAVITRQMPTVGGVLNATLGSVILYTEQKEEETAVVPSLIGLSPKDATAELLKSGLNIRLSGASCTGAEAGIPKAYSQSIPPGTAVARGTPITVRFLFDDRE